jgi:hypothetical protein
LFLVDRKAVDPNFTGRFLPQRLDDFQRRRLAAPFGPSSPKISPS